MRERYRMKNILGFGLGPDAGAIHENNLAAHPVHNQSEGRGRADHSRAHDANFHSLIATRAVLGMPTPLHHQPTTPPACALFHSPFERSLYGVRAPTEDKAC